MQRHKAVFTRVQRSLSAPAGSVLRLDALLGAVFCILAHSPSALTIAWAAMENRVLTRAPYDEEQAGIVPSNFQDLLMSVHLASF